MIDETYRFDPNDIGATHGLSILSYLSLLFLVPMLVYPNSPFTRFHVNQGIVLLLLSIVGGIVARIADYIPFIGWIVAIAIRLALLALVIVGIINAAQGTAKRLPIIGNIELYK